MKVIIQRHSCASGSQYYATTNDVTYGPLTIDERSQIESGVLPNSVFEKADPVITCGLKSQCQYQVNTDALQIHGTGVENSPNLDSTSSDMAGPEVVVREVTTEVRIRNEKENIKRDYPLYTELLPNPLAADKGPISAGKLASNYWRRASTDEQKENQENLVAKSLTVLRQYLHHQLLSEKIGTKVLLKTSFTERLALSEINDPDLIRTLQQAQENVTYWLTVGAAYNRLNVTVMNYADMIAKHFDNISVDPQKAFELVCECALDLLWSWKRGSVFGYLNKYLHARLYTRLNKEKRVTGAYDATFIPFKDGCLSDHIASWDGDPNAYYEGRTSEY